MIYSLIAWLVSVQSLALLGTPEDIGIPDITLNSGSVKSVLNVVYFIATVVAVIVIIVAGIIFSTSLGDTSKVSRARNTIIYAAIGLVVVIVAYSITAFVAGSF